MYTRIEPLTMETFSILIANLGASVLRPVSKDLVGGGTATSR